MTADVAVAHVEFPMYPQEPPYHPGDVYPEYRLGEHSPQPNHAYAAVREAFHLNGMDSANYGTDRWNPLGTVIEPGDRVVIKPNFVLSFNEEGHGLDPVVTHPSVLRAIADYAFIALQGSGSVRIADAPQWDCDFEELSAWGGFEAITAFYERHRLDFAFLDLRKLRRRVTDRGYVRQDDRVYLDGDPNGYTVVDLGARSALADLPNPERLYGSDYDRTETVSHHHEGRHEYLVSRTVLEADIVINAPKMKVHKKVGVTLNIKNLVGINGDKNYLPHYRVGSPREGGDEYPDTMDVKGRKALAARTWLQERLLTSGSRVGEFIYSVVFGAYRLLRDGLHVRVDKPVVAGNWHRNDTCWRMAVDLMNILIYADADGTIRDEPQRRFLSVVDGIVGGQLHGPLSPKPIASGWVVVGDHPYAVDMAVTRLMGFDWRKVPQLGFAQAEASTGSLAERFRLADPDALRVHARDGDVSSMMRHRRRVGVEFDPHPGWRGHIELLADEQEPNA